MVGTAAACTSFAEASALLADLAGLRIGPKQVERTAETLGREIDAAERSGQVFATEPPAAPTLYLGIDGTGVPVCKSETAGRAGKQPDGSAKTREAKLITVWSAESRHPQTGRPQRGPGSVSYCGAIESAADFRKPRGASCWATELVGSGRYARSSSRGPCRSSTSSTPRSISGRSPGSCMRATTP